MIRAATTFAGPCTGAPRRDFLLGMRRGQPVGAHVPSWCSRHGWTLVAPDELARLASLQLVATRRLRRVQDGGPRRPWCARVEVLNTTRGRRPWVRLARLAWIWRRASFRSTEPMPQDRGPFRT